MDNAEMPKKPATTAQAKIDASLAKLKAISERKRATAPQAQTEQQMKLELWPENVRGVPNAVLRGALFGVSARRKVHKKRTLIATTGQYQVRFLGVTFNQSDLDVLENMLHIASPHPMGKRVEFSLHAFLKEMGRGTGGKDHEELKEQIARLAAGLVEITDTQAGLTFASTFVSKFFRDEKTGHHIIIMDKDMLTLYQSGYTLIDWERRKSLGQKNLAKWLHDFYSTNAEPYAYKVQTLHGLCGSDTKELRKFRQQLRKALDDLVRAGAIKGWQLDDDDLVHVDRQPSASQRKHLAKAKKARKAT